MICLEKVRNTSQNELWLETLVLAMGREVALGALGRRFESCRPDSNNPTHRKVSQPVFFIG